jgi:DNA polymerase-3 subunit delta'
MITGPKGIGKATFAWRIAKYLLCSPIKEEGASLFGDTPGVIETLDIDPHHPVLRRIQAGSEGRLSIVRRPFDAKRKLFKAQITIEEIRKLKSFFALSAADGGRRVVIIDAADDMNVNAANALLKVLEEPPQHTILLLISHQPSRLLPTIRSRCRTLRLSALSQVDIDAVLATQELEIDPAEMGVLSSLSAGSAGEAIRLAQHNGPAVYHQILGLIAQAPKIDRPSAIKFSEQYAGRTSSEDLDILALMFDRVLSRLAVFGATGDAPAPLAHAGEIEIFKKLCPAPQFAQDWAELCQDLSNRFKHGRAVNLDHVALVLDMIFKIEQCAKRAQGLT